MCKKKILILDTCYDCPHSSAVWVDLSENAGSDVVNDNDDDFELRYGCLNTKAFVEGVKEENGRLVSVTDDFRDRPSIPEWCPLEDN